MSAIKRRERSESPKNRYEKPGKIRNTNSKYSYSTCESISKTTYIPHIPKPRRMIHFIGKKYKPCTAAGVLFYTVIKKEIYFLLQYNKVHHYYEDFGGKAEFSDKTPYHTAVREAVEETNASIFTGHSKNINEYRRTKRRELHMYHKNYYKHKTKCFSVYVPWGKYMLYLNYTEPELSKKLTPTRFGTHEFEENVSRDIVGLSKNKLLDLIKSRRCNPRLDILPSIIKRISL